MVDIHSHILHGIDDGPRTPAASHQMLELAIQSGTTVMVATPHSDLRYSYDRGTVEARLAQLRTFAAGRIQLLPGCEFHLSFENLRQVRHDASRFTINHGRFLLVEFSDEGIPRNASELLHGLLNSGLVPNVAHPERNPILRRRLDALGAWVQAGCRIQVTAQCLIGSFGRSAQTFSHQLMHEGLAHIIASDTHDPRHRPPGLAEAYHLVEQRYGHSEAVALCIENPGAVVTNGHVPLMRMRTRPLRRWFSLFSAAS